MVSLDKSTADRADLLFQNKLHENYKKTDHLFIYLMAAQWIFSIILSIVVSPLAWEGAISKVHIHVWAAVLLGGLISMLPIAFAFFNSGTFLTRCIIAIGQASTSALLIHLTGGRIETHFHVFGSLAILALYRDWRVLIPFTIVVALDHALRGIYWPQSVYGVLYASPWRFAEHAAWVVFEDIFLVILCRRSVHELKLICERTAELEHSFHNVDQQVAERTQEIEEREEETKMILQSASDAFVGMDIHGSVIAWNNQAEKMFGWKRDEVLGKPLHEIIMPERFRKLHKEGMERFLKTGEAKILNRRVELVGLKRSGEEFPIELVVWFFSHADKKVFYSFIADIAIRKKADSREMELLDEARKNIELTAQKNEELARFNKLAVGRELEMINLKNEINELLKQSGKPPKFGAK